jgi:arginyl-tRNA synthetase
MRKSEQHMDFDIDLAKSKTNDNPVFYIQYAHARIYSVLLKAGIKKLKEPDLSLLESKYEESLIRHLNKYNDVLLSAAKQYEPHQLAHYLRELAGYFHSYYSSCEFLIDDENLKNSRLNLITAVRQVIKNGLQILGVSVPNKM